jgi:SAM-dependent methyltransferase
MANETGFLTKEEIGAFYDGKAVAGDRAFRAGAYYREQLGRLVRDLVPEGKRVLDIGCGQGDLLAALRPADGLGVDLSPAMIERARRRHPHLRFAVADAETLSLQEGAFDVVLLSNTIGYLQDIQAALQRLRGCCSPDTRLIITHYNFLWEPVLKLAERLGLKAREPYQNWLSLADIQNVLALAGFETVRTRQSVLLPVRIPLLSTLCNRWLSRLPVLWRMALIGSVVARPGPVPAVDARRTCSVIVPARNERGNIEAVVRRIPEMGKHTEIVFVEGHSRDGTLDEIRRVAAACPGRDIKVLRQTGEGKGDAVRAGFEHASGDVLIILDADLSIAPEDLPKFFDAVASGQGELVIGSRLVYRPQKDSMRFLNMLGNKFFSLAFSYLLDRRIKDTLCGTKALLRRDYQAIARNRMYFGDFDPFGDFDLIFGAARASLSIREIPVRYYARAYGATQIKRFRHGLLLLRMTFLAMRKLKFAP